MRKTTIRLLIAFFFLALPVYIGGVFCYSGERIISTPRTAKLLLNASRNVPEAGGQPTTAKQAGFFLTPGGEYISYPPELGDENTIVISEKRLVFRSVLCGVAASIGILSVLISLLSPNKVSAVLYALICLSFIVYISYPIIHTFAQSFFPLYYTMENISFYAPELASFGLIIAVGFMSHKEIAAQYSENVILHEQARSLKQFSVMQQMVDPLLKQKIEEANAARHDFRHHLVMINGFLNNGQYDKLQSYVSQYQDSIQLDEPVRYAQNDVANVLAHYYKHIANKNGIELTLRLEIDKVPQISDADLCSLMSNMLENGIEACKRQKNNKRFIIFTAIQKKSILAIKMENSGGESVNMKDSVFISSKKSNRKGYGLESVKTVAKRYRGVTDFRCDNISKVFCSTVVLTL